MFVSWMYSWINDILTYLGLAQKKGKLVFLGLDNAGKTSLLYRLRDDKMSAHVPTHLPTSEELSLGGVRFLTYDLGGHEQVRRVWREYTPAVDGIVFIIDVACHARMEEARVELQALMTDENVAHVPIAVVGNKIDKAGALSEEQLKWSMGLQHQCTGKDTQPQDCPSRPVEVFMCSVLQRQGYGAPLKWIASFL
ncbi:hypothetical protein PRIPAC_81012 [Pristionchus pacificus]|uniref:small monomeric GTPase n=1 Tax=Pristionchus pacificus TaxID=54126 RepID=A0A2A6CK44_PRIPA|nr:hypothetical protein PRIPAC_81012 [Pristionchus pacificus]|eukprot:PDM78476.1 ADP ribosylation factor [Pristionchus pacificus]